MATSKPRITITLEPHRHVVLKRLAALQGVSMSYLVADLVETVAEPLERVLAVMEAAKKAPGEVKQGLRAAVAAAERDFMPAAEHAMEHFNEFLAAAKSAGGATGDARSAAPGVPTVPQPPFSNTGVRSEKQGGSGVEAKGVKPKRRKASNDEMAGIDWWNALSERERASWCKKTGSAVPAEAWAAFKRQGV